MSNVSLYVGSLASIPTRDHSLLTSLTADDHTQYALLTGRSGGQTLKGGTGSTENLTLSSTSHTTKGKIYFNSSVFFNEATDQLSIGEPSPNSLFTIRKDSANTGYAASFFQLVNRQGAVGTEDSFTFLFKDTGAASGFAGAGIIARQTNDSARSAALDFYTTTFDNFGTTPRLTIDANGDIILKTTTAKLDLSTIAAGNPNLKITATSDTPTVAFTGGGNAPTTAPAGYLEILVGASARYIPFWA